MNTLILEYPLFDRALDSVIKGLRKLFVGLSPNEGETMRGALLLNNTTTDRGTNIDLILFTNSSGVDETIAAASLTQPSGGGYATKTLTDGSWTESPQGQWNYALQQFSFSGAVTGSVYGYALLSKGTTPRIIGIEVDANGPYTFGNGDTYDVTPQNTFT